MTSTNTPPTNKLAALLQSENKWLKFGLLLLTILAVGTILSLVTRVVLIKDNEATRPRLAVVAPQNTAGASLRQGAELYAATLNRQGGHQGRPLEILAVDETDKAVDTVLADKRVVGVVGYVDPTLLKAAAAKFNQAKVPVVTPLPLTEPLPGMTGLGLDPKEQARFAANYARNIQQQRLMYVVRESGAEYDPLVEPFVEVYKRFDTPVRQTWTITPGAESDAQIKQVLEEIKKIDVGAVYVATNPDLAARLVKGIRSTGNVLEIFGPAQLATGALLQGLKSYSGKDAAIQSHGIIAATPVLFDTANEQAQRFQTSYQQKYGVSPDWLATYAYDAAKVALSAKPGVEELKGVNGTLEFVDGQAQLPIQMGVFNGQSLISAPVQLLPIAKGAGFNYIEALRQGRVLYVNDRFMFRTNVVYVGVTVNEISDVDRQAETAMVDMSIWFRYRGKFTPQDLQVLNAVEPVKFGNPEEIKEDDEIQYRRYRIKQKFQLNFTNDKRSYNQHVAGISFRHRLLNRNNLLYVVDILGMPTGNALVNDLQQRRVVKTGAGWEVENAWISQDVVRVNGDGAPQYVGMTGEQPLFSNITMGVLLKPASASARDIIPGEYFIYIAILGLLGALAAIGLDFRRGRRYWVVQAWLLRVIFWPLLLLSVGNLVVDWAFNHLTLSTTRIFVLVYESLWWIVAGMLLDKAIRRFIWDTLEDRTQRKVPNVMKFFVSVLVFGMAFAGITAFVFNQTLTSLLATSGVLVMVIGLAIQANIANVFSGIVLNIERPFKVGDSIRINNITGQVSDITWRTTRIVAYDGQTVSLANSKVSEAFIENYSEIPNGLLAETAFYAPPEADPDKVLAIITEAVAASTAVKRDVEARFAPIIRYRGVVNVDGQWVGEYGVICRVASVPARRNVRQELWMAVRKKFIEAGIGLTPVVLLKPDQEPKIDLTK